MNDEPTTFSVDAQTKGPTAAPVDASADYSPQTGPPVASPTTSPTTRLRNPTSGATRTVNAGSRSARMLAAAGWTEAE